jgi:hypothetical protein
MTQQCEIEEIARALIIARFGIEQGAEAMATTAQRDNWPMWQDALRDARAAYEVMARSDGWLPIESAPKDGTEILTWGYLHDDGGPVDEDGRSFMGETPDWQISRWHEMGCWFSAEWGSHEPTHWRPLPDPPSSIRELPHD